MRFVRSGPKNAGKPPGGSLPAARRSVRVAYPSLGRRAAPTHGVYYYSVSLFLRANKVLGYETSRGRLYTKHQDLFKYASDQEDKEWLAKNHLIQPTGGKAFLCILQDIHELAVSQEYK